MNGFWRATSGKVMNHSHRNDVVEIMAGPEGPPKPWYRNSKKLLILGAILSVVIFVPTIVYYDLSYNSVNGTHPELVTGYRSAGYFSATFYITVHVW